MNFNILALLLITLVWRSLADIQNPRNDLELQERQKYIQQMEIANHAEMSLVDGNNNISIEWNQAPIENQQQNPNQRSGQVPRHTSSENLEQARGRNNSQDQDVANRPNDEENINEQFNSEPVLQYLSSLAIENKNLNLINLTKNQISLLAIASTNTFSTLLRLNPSRIERFTMSSPNNRYWITSSFLKIGILTNTTQTSQCNPDAWDKSSTEDIALSTGLVYNFRLNTTETELKESIGIRQNARQLQNSPNSQYFSNFLRDKLIQDGGNAFFQLNYHYIIEVGRALNIPENEIYNLASYFNNSPNQANSQMSCARVHYLSNNIETQRVSNMVDNSMNSMFHIMIGSVDTTQALYVVVPLFVLCLIGLFALFVRNFSSKNSSEETIRLNENV